MIFITRLYCSEYSDKMAPFTKYAFITAILTVYMYFISIPLSSLYIHCNIMFYDQRLSELLDQNSARFAKPCISLLSNVLNSRELQEYHELVPCFNKAQTQRPKDEINRCSYDLCNIIITCEHIPTFVVISRSQTTFSRKASRKA